MNGSNIFFVPLWSDIEVRIDAITYQLGALGRLVLVGSPISGLRDVDAGPSRRNCFIPSTYEMWVDLDSDLLLYSASYFPL